MFVPTPEWQNLEWHEACIAAKGLCIQHCVSCGAWRHPPRRYCGSCWSDESQFDPVSGDGVVASFAVSHRSIDPAWAAKAPFVTLVVELREGPRVLATYDGAPGSVEIGDKTTIDVETVRDDFVMLHARQNAS
jgi:uncharacterized OB-fold protein